jgi:hypothetical protein
MMSYESTEFHAEMFSFGDLLLRCITSLNP